ncbi:hypothetical protein C8T65DRAFT_21288 [Cerioporus squamosus]|nr:hypothetical protein C8T65DRAFT_21288 [Cerioporus squamosus]
MVGNVDSDSESAFLAIFLWAEPSAAAREDEVLLSRLTVRPEGFEFCPRRTTSSSPKDAATDSGWLERVAQPPRARTLRRIPQARRGLSTQQKGRRSRPPRQPGAGSIQSFGSKN